MKTSIDKIMNFFLQFKKNWMRFSLEFLNWSFLKSLWIENKDKDNQVEFGTKKKSKNSYLNSIFLSLIFFSQEKKGSNKTFKLEKKNSNQSNGWFDKKKNPDEFRQWSQHFDLIPGTDFVFSFPFLFVFW